MYTYYHNPRCQKSREGLALLEEAGASYILRKYLEEPLTQAELEALLDKLALPAEALIRQNEKDWKAHFKDKELSEEELILAMIEYPKLMQRPILESDKSAVLGRPPEKIKELL
ncbi:MAG: arsenate reductase (glutaredoxin) [Schleiferiaceae bacterium]|jgi:arsenate reductase|nr:arsenate reductase (glutaredoxin) [Schleiferiaceae bacterium]MDR9441963.1 arsenate reductase (glutaredoxin) [Schleiferiaceae bacterium]